MSLRKEVCSISGDLMDVNEMVPAATLRKNLFLFIQSENPELEESGYISKKVLRGFRKRYLEQLIEDENGELDKVEKQVIDAITDQATIAENLEQNLGQSLSYGQRLADRVAEFGGSWAFISSFGVILLVWIVFNSWVLKTGAFDPYPYILLNLILSCLAALQAPVIMMSQNRQEAKDRQRSEYDYKVNLKAELEIRLLHDKLDHLMVHQAQKILELQQMQIDMLEEMSRGKKE